MNHQEMTLKGKMKNRNNICCRQAEPCAATPSRGAFHHALHYFLTAITMLFCLGVNGAWAEVVRSWDFVSEDMPSSVQTELGGSEGTTQWTWDSTNSLWKNVGAINGAELTTDGSTKLTYTEGLLFKVGGADKIRFRVKGNSRLQLNGKDIEIKISGLSVGQKLTVVSITASNSSDRGLTIVSNLTNVAGFGTVGKEDITNVATVTADGDVSFKSNVGGVYIKSILVESAPTSNWRDIKLDFTGESSFIRSQSDVAAKIAASQDPAWTAFNTGVAIAEDGTPSCVAVDAQDSRITLNAKYHGTDYGIQPNTTFVVPVEGPVTITYGMSNASGTVTISDTNRELTGFSINFAGGRWTPDPAYRDRVATYTYKGGPTTLTCSGGDYVPYFAVEKYDGPLTADYTVTFANETAGVAGNVPSAVTKGENETMKIPANTFMYKEGYTLVGWSDGVNTYRAGDNYTFTKDETLTAVFEQNAFELDERTAEAVVNWDLSHTSGLNISTGSFYVTQAEVTKDAVTKTIDVKFDVTLGTVASNGDWVKLNNGTKLTVPSCKDAIVEFRSHGVGTVTANGGATTETDGTNHIFQYTATADGNVVLEFVPTTDVTHYIKYLKVTLPVPSAPTSEIPTFSLTEEQAVISNKTPDGWTAVQLPQIPEITESNAVVVSGLVAEADNTAAIQAALDAVPNDGGMVVVPAGTWLSGPLTMKSKTVLHLKAGATLRLLPYGNGADGKTASAVGYYPTNGTNDKGNYNYKMFLTCVKNASTSDIVVEGEGETSIIDGQGAQWWDKRDVLGTRPPLIRFEQGQRFLFRNFKLQNAPGTNLTLGNSGNASHFTVHDVTISNPSSESDQLQQGEVVSHNTDGIPVWGPYVNIYDCNISTGDDNIVADRDAHHLHAWNINCGYGHGMSIGSYTERLHDVIYEDITFTNTTAGFRIKTNNDRSGNDQEGTNGAVKNIICRNATMTGVPGPIKITSWYDDDVQDPSTVSTPSAITATTPEFCNITFQNITADAVEGKTSWKHNSPIYIYGRPEMKIHDITFDNVQIESKRGMFLAYYDGLNFINNCSVNATSGVAPVATNYGEGTITGTYVASNLTAVTTTKQIEVGRTYTLAKPTDYTTSSTGAVTFASSNDAVATVNATTGEITAVAAGTATITISQAADATYNSGTADITVTVNPAVETETVTIFDAADEGWTADGVNLTTGTTTVNGVTWYGRSGAEMKSNNLEFSDKVSWTKYLKTGGSSTFKSGSDLAGVLTYTPTKAGKIRVYAKGGGDTERYLYISQSITSTNRDATTAIGTSVTGTSSGVGIATADVEANKPVYIWATNSMLVYGITFESVVEPTHTWDFTNWSAATKTQVLGDTEGWTKDEGAADNKKYITGDQIRWANANNVDADGNLTAGGQVIKELEGLHHTGVDQYKLGLAFDYQNLLDGNQNNGWGPYHGGSYLWVMGNSTTITIPNVKKGSKLKIGVESHKYLPADDATSEARGFQVLVGGTEVGETQKTKEYTEFSYDISGTSGVVDVVLKATKGCHLYWIDAEQGEPEEPTPAPSYPITATWDFKNGVPSTITGVNIQGKTEDVASDKDGINLAVDATVTDGKLQYNASGYAQFNNGTIIHVPVTSKYDEINVVAFPGQNKYTIGGAAAAESQSYNPSDAEVTQEFVEIKATGGAYLYSISVTQQGAGYVPTVDWDPTWDSTNNRWVVKTSNNADAAVKATENAKGLTEALKYIASQTNKTLYIPNGTYDLGTKAQTAVPAGATLKGESMEGVIIKNNPEYEGIGITATLQIDGDNVTLEDLTLYCRAPYGTTLKDGNPTSSNAERGVCLVDRGTNNIFRHITLDGLQDTYYSWKSNAANTSYFYDCVLKGSVDFLCGSGNVWFENCTLGVVPGHSDNNGTLSKNAPYIIAPNADNPDYGYIFNNCTIVNGSSVNMDGNYYLGRPWNAHPKASFINTTMKILPKADGFSMQSAGTGGYVASEWTEIGSVDGLGNPVNTNSRMSDVTVISKSKPEAQKLPAPEVTKSGSKITWTAVDGAIAYNVYKDGVFQAKIDVPTSSAAKGMFRTLAAAASPLEYDITGAEDATWTVRAINALRVIGLAQGEEPEVVDPYEDITFSDEAQVIKYTNKPFAYATANDRTNPASVSASNITGGGEYDLETIMQKMEADGGYTAGTTKQISTSNGTKKAIVLRSANTVETVDDKKKETRVPMDDAIFNAIKANDIIVLDGSGTSTDFVVSKYIQLSRVKDKTIVGINGARLCTEWYLTDYFKSLLENVPTSSGTGVNSASTTSGGGALEIIKNGSPYVDNIPEEGEYLTRKTLLEATGDKTEAYRNAGIFYIDHSSNLIIRNFKFIGPGSLDCAGYDLMAIIDDTHHCWVDHCEFVDGMDGNFDITNRSDFVTVSWCQFRYTERSYAHQNTNLVGSSDDKTDDRNKLNITFAYNEWGANCRARMPMARFGRIHMLNNYYNCAGNSEYAMNPRKESQFLVEGNYWEKGVRRAYNPNGQTAVTWGDNNFYADKAADKAGENTGSTVTVPYQYSALMLDPMKVPEVLTLNGGAKLYQKPYFTTNLGVVDTDKTAPYEYTAVLSECEDDGLVFSVWAENAHTFQWYKQDIALDGTPGEWEMIEGENRNTYTYMPKTGVTFNIKCKAFGVSGETESDELKVVVDGESKPIYITDLDDTKTVEVISGSPKILTVNAGTNGVTYQWYKSANADGSSATVISGATDRSYTYKSTATTGEVVYLFCRATNQQGYTDSKIVKVKGIYRNVKFHMYATYDANVVNSNGTTGKSSVFVDGGTSNINNVNSQTANITDDGDGCKATTSNTNDISGLRFENAEGSTHTPIINVHVHFTPTTPVAIDDKIEIKMNTSSVSAPDNKYGFYLSKSATITGDEDANILQKIGIPTSVGKGLHTYTYTATEALETFYLIPFVDGTKKNINLANVVVYSGETTKPIDAPMFTKNLDASYEVSQDGTLELEVDYDDNDVSAVQWYKTNSNVAADGTIIAGEKGKKYSVPTSEMGMTYYYAVITGKAPYNETKVASVSTKVVVKAKPAGTKVYTYDMGKYPGATASEQSSATDATADIPSLEDPDGHKASMQTKSTKQTKYKLEDKTFGDGFKSTGYIRFDGGTANSGNYVKVVLDKDDSYISVYAKGANTSRSAIVFTDLQSIPTEADHSKALLFVPLGGASGGIDGYGTTEALKKGTYYVGVTNSSYIYGIVVKEPADATAPKDIVHYKIANDASLTKNTEYEAELGKIVFGNVSITKVTPAEGDPFSGNKLDGDASATGTKYAKIIMPEGMPVKEGDIIKISGFQDKAETPSGYGFSIYPTRAEGMTKAKALSITKTKNTLEDLEYKVPSGSSLIDKTEFFVFREGNTVYLTEITITREMKAETECSKPIAKKTTWNATADETWNYTISSSTPTAVIHYQVGSGEEVVASVAPKNSVNVALKPGDTVKAWATDSQSKIDDSEVNEFTVAAKPQTAKPTITVALYSIAKKGFDVTISGAAAGAKVYYTTDGTAPTDASTLYNGVFTSPGDMTIKAIAIEDHYNNSDIASANIAKFDVAGTEDINVAHGSASNENNVGVSYFVLGSEYNAGGIETKDPTSGIKFRVNRTLADVAGKKTLGFRIKVNDGFVINKIEAVDAYTNAKESDKKGSATVKAAYVDVTDGNYAGATSVLVKDNLTLPYSDKTHSKELMTKDNINARTQVDFVCELSEGASVNQAGILFKVYYEVIDAPKSVTINGAKLSDTDYTTLTGADKTVVLTKEYNGTPTIIMNTEKGYEHPMVNVVSDDAYRKYQCTIMGTTYTVKAMVESIEAPFATIAEEVSLAGGYKVTVTPDPTQNTVAMISIDGGEYEVYDAKKTYYALKTVDTKTKYTKDEVEKFTDVRSLNCPTNSYTAGKPFAVYLYVNGYSDNQVGSHAYNNESFKTDKIYSAIANQFNVIPLAVNNSDAILEKRSDITDAKLVVITETLGGSGSVEIAGVGNKSNMMALTLKRDVLDKTNVLNLKMFLNGSSAANNQRWQWAQPRAMASELTSIMPCTPDGGGMYEIFGNATMSRDASINLWDDVSTENMLYHLQPVFNFNDENDTRPIFTPLALVIDPEEPEDQREQYHAIHTYKNGVFQYIGFGLSINEWTQYNNNVYAIIDKIGEMIKAGKSLDSKLTGIVKPTVTDNGDGSANVFNNNPNADTYYVLYTEDDVKGQSFDQPSANDIINGNVAGHTTFHANETDFHTEKFTANMHIFAVSKLGSDATSAVVEGTVAGNSIRYVIRENDDPAAQGMVAKYPFDLTVDEGTFNMPYNQSWKKDGYTVTAWQVTKSSDPALVGTTIVPGTSVSSLTQDITVKAVWTKNTKKVTDLSKTEDKAHRTVTWEFLQSKGAPAIAMESKAGNMQAILVGQAKFSDGTFIDVPMTINTDNLATSPDNGTEYHGKFNNTSTNWAAELTDGLDHYTGSDYAQVRTGTQFTFPAVYGMNVVYKQVDLVEAVNGVANGNVNRSQVSQSYLNDGTKTDDVLKTWRFVNPGFQLDANGKVVMVDGVAQLAKTSPMYEAFKTKGQALGLYDEKNGGNHVNGGLIYYTGDGTEATMTSVESAQYIHVGATTGKPLGGLNSGSVFMQSLSVTYPELYDLECKWYPEYSELDKDEHPGKIEKLTVPRPNCGGRYVLNDDIVLKLTPAYGYYVDVDSNDDPATDGVDESYYFLKNGMSATSALDITNGGVITTSAIYRYKDPGYAGYSDEIKANIPEDGAYITMKVMDIDLVVSMKKWTTMKYKVEAYPSTQGYITFNSGNGRPHEDEYEEFPVGKKFYITAHPNTGYKFKEWRRNTGTGEILVSEEVYDALDNKTGYWALPDESVTFGNGIMVNPFDKNDYLETNELMFIAGTDNYGNNNDFTYVAVFEKAKTGTGYYEFDYALLKTAEGQAHSAMTPIKVSDDDKNQFPSEFTSELLNFPKYYTLFKPGYTLDHWVEISGKDETVDGKHVFTPGVTVDDVFTPSPKGEYTFGKPYNPGSYYNFTTEGEVKHLVPVFTKNPTSYDYRATPVDIKWDLRVAERAQRVDFRSGTNGNTAADTKIYYSTHATINGDVRIDVPLTITLGKKGKLVNDIEEEDKWCAMGEGTTIVIPSGLGAKFTIASLSKMETTTIDGVVPTSYTVEKIDDANVYLYTFTTQSEATSVTLKIGDDYTYYKYIRAELPAADAVPLTTTVNNPAFGTVEIEKARTTADAVNANNTALLAKINATKVSLPSGEGQGGASYTLGLGTIVSLHAKRTHLYVLDYFEDGEGNRYSYKAGTLCVTDKSGKDITAAATAQDEYLKMEKVQDIMKSQNDLQLTFQVQSYSESMHAVYKENTLYQVNYTSGEEAEGEAPGMTLVEDGESFTIPAENHHLYLDGQTLRYWMDEDGNKYDLGQSYTLGQTFTASKDLPSGITSGKGFTVPKKDIFLTPVFKVNDFTVMNLSQTATATWPLSRKGTANYDGNGDIVINFEGINGIYVTPLKVTDAGGNVIDFIDLKMDIRGENGKANNVNSTDRCQVNSGTVFGLPSSSNCTFTLKSANSSIAAKIDGTAVEGQQTVSSSYTGDKTQIEVNFTGNTYLYEVVAEYNPVTTDLPELDYATVGNISLGALGTSLAGYKLSTLKKDGEVSGVPADLSNSTTGIMPVVRGTATRGGYVDVTQATIDNPVATMLVKTRDGVTVSVYKIEFKVTYPNIAPRVTDLKVDRKFQCDLKKMYAAATTDLRVDSTNYINDVKYLKHLGVDGETPEKANMERVAINGVINIKFSTKMAETTIPAATFQANNGKATLGQAVYALEGQTLTFTYKGLAVNTEYDFIIPAGTFKDVFWAETTGEKAKAKHVYNEDIRIHFTTVETAISTDRRVINYVVTHNQASHFDTLQAKMVADGERVQVASSELIANLEAAGIPYGTLDDGVKLANAYKESGKRFYIFVPDGEYQLMGNDSFDAPKSTIGEDGKTLTLGTTKGINNGITTVTKDNVSITGQSQEKTIVYNHPAFEGLSYTSTLKLNGGIANFYAQDMTLQNKFDFLRCRKVAGSAVAPALWDRSQKAIFKNVKFDSYQDTYYTNSNNQFDDTRGYAEDCTIMGYVDFVCGDGDHWFQNCDMVVRQGVGSTATNMFAAQHYDTQKWGYVMNKCTFSAENATAFDVNNGKMTIARPWKNSPAETLIECKFNVLSTDDGYKKMNGGGLILRMQEYKSYDSDDKILDLSKRSLRNSTPGIGSYDAVMTPSKAAEYNLFDVMGGEDGYDPTLYTAQVDMATGIKQDDTFLTWDDQKEALCYFLFTKDNESDTDWKLFAVTDGTEFEMGNAQIDKWFCVRAANQRGGLGAPTEAFQYKAHESYKRELINNAQVIDGWRWSTIYLDFDAKAPVVQHEEMVDGDMKTVDDIYVYALVKVDATKLTFKRVKTMEKNCGYLIKARPRPEDYEFKYTEKTPVYYNGMTVPEYRTAQSLSVEEFPHMSLMTGSVTNVPAAGTAGYTLASKTSYGLGFYKYVGKTYNANYAWLDAAYVAEAQKAMADGSLDAAAKAGYMQMVFDDDIEDDYATDINGVYDREGSEGILDMILDPDAVIYDLHGRKVRADLLRQGEVYIFKGIKFKR